MLARMTSRELSEWLAFSQIEPIGEARADLRAGLVASVVANTVRDAKRQPKPFTPQQFTLRFEDDPDPAPDAVAEKVAAALGGPIG